MAFDVNNTESLVKMLQQQSQANTAASMEAAEKQMAFQVAQNAKAMEFNAEQASMNRAWQERLSNTAHQREVKDLIAAGINPVLTATGGNGASVGSGSTASGVTSAGAIGSVDTSANAAMSSIIGSVMNAAASMHNAEVSAKGVTDAAAITAAANKFIAQNYPSSYAGLLREVIAGVTGGGLRSSAESLTQGLVNIVKSIFGLPINDTSYHTVDKYYGDEKKERETDKYEYRQRDTMSDEEDSIWYKVYKGSQAR